ncbi:MAG: FxLYD domain-containing protein [Candidatus Solibacter sp.]
MKRIREFFESIAFAGLKPSGGSAAGPKKKTWFSPVQERLERHLAGGPAPNDPLYLSNRTMSQKMRAWSLIAIPCLILAIGIGVTLYVLEPPEAEPVKQFTAAEIAAKVLPNMDKQIRLTPPSAIQVLEITVSESHVKGVVQNMTNRDIAGADLVIELTNATGSQVGAVNTSLDKIPASGRREFTLPIKQRDATFALIREMVTH